jgi:hypothetical protein
VDRDPDPLGFAVQLGYCIGIHIGKQPWQAKATRGAQRATGACLVNSAFTEKLTLHSTPPWDASDGALSKRYYQEFSAG